MIDSPKNTTATRPYLIRALYEWCTDNGFTPYLAVSVNNSVRVPREFVKDGEIVLNIGFDATSSLKLGNEFIEFKGRFAGVARDIVVPVSQVIAIYARENGQGMAFPLISSKGDEASDTKVIQLASVESERRTDEPTDEPNPPPSSTNGSRPILKRVK